MFDNFKVISHFKNTKPLYYLDKICYWTKNIS